MNEIFNLPKTEFLELLSNFFNKKVKFLRNNHCNFVLNVSNKSYEILDCWLPYEEVRLTILWDTGYKQGWYELFKDYPELKGVLWEAVEEKLNKTKTDKISLLKKMIDQNNAELEELRNVQPKINKLEQDNEEKQNEIEKIKRTLDDVQL